jgi:hypothetical protein
MPYRSPKDINAIFQEGTEIDRALKRAVREAVRRHKLLGNPIAVWQDNQVVWLQPDEIPVEPDEDPG